MVKSIFSKLLIATVLIGITTSTYAIEMHFGYNIDYIFKPNEPQDLVNNFFFTIQAKCDIKLIDGSADISAKILDGSGSLNSNELNKGEQIVLTVHNNDTLNIIAHSGATVRMTNLGPNDVIATCYPI